MPTSPLRLQVRQSKRVFFRWARLILRKLGPRRLIGGPRPSFAFISATLSLSVLSCSYLVQQPNELPFEQSAGGATVRWNSLTWIAEGNRFGRAKIERIRSHTQSSLNPFWHLISGQSVSSCNRNNADMFRRDEFLNGIEKNVANEMATTRTKRIH